MLVFSCLQRADQALADFFTSIANTMAGLFQVITGQKEAQVSIAPPSFFNNGAANVSTSVAGISGAVRPPSLTPSSQRGRAACWHPHLLPPSLRTSAQPYHLGAAFQLGQHQ